VAERPAARAAARTRQGASRAVRSAAAVVEPRGPAAAGTGPGLEAEAAEPAAAARALALLCRPASAAGRAEAVVEVTVVEVTAPVAAVAARARVVAAAQAAEEPAPARAAAPGAGTPGGPPVREGCPLRWRPHPCARGSSLPCAFLFPFRPCGKLPCAGARAPGRALPYLYIPVRGHLSLIRSSVAHRPGTKPG
jgi:hypothetical protein